MERRLRLMTKALEKTTKAWKETKKVHAVPILV